MLCVEHHIVILLPSLHVPAQFSVIHLCVVCVCLLAVVLSWGGCLSPMSTDSRFLFTENIQFSYVSLRCTSSGHRMRSRHGRKAGEEYGSSITAEFELDVNLEEVTGWSLCASCL